MRNFRQRILGLLWLASCGLLLGCPQQQPAAPAQPAAVPATGSAAERPTLAIVFGASENDEWTAALLNVLGSELGIDPLSQPAAAAAGLDVFGPYDCELEGQPLALALALCDLSSVSDLAAQQQLGKLAQDWIGSVKPAAVWLDGDQLQLHCGAGLDPQWPIVFTGVKARSDAYYEEGRAVCGLLRQHSLARTMGELFKRVPEAKEVALVCDTSALGRSRVREVRDLEQAMPMGVTFVTQEPAASLAALGKQVRGLDSGIDAVLVCGIAEHPQETAGPDLFGGVKPPVLVYGPTQLDNSGVLSLRIKPAAHAREALILCSEILAGKAAAPLGVRIPDEMELYQSER